ncbi:MAG: ribosome small subunit-dependent GTPase A [Acidobacteriota bacterium]
MQRQLESLREEHGDDLAPARVLFAARGHYRVLTREGEARGEAVSLLSQGGRASPAVGDWVLVERLEADHVRLRALFDRASLLSRRAAGRETKEQLVAANVDTVFVVMGLDGDYNLRRLERFVVMVQESGAQPVVVLTKLDLCRESAERRADAMGVAPGVPVVCVHALADEGLGPLRFYLQSGDTVALIGSSGAGKSTLINALAGEEVMKTGSVRDGDDRGRHTTTHRELLRLPGGGLIVDNPGVREVQLWIGEETVEEAFFDLSEVEGECRFRNCRHQNEPGCAVLAAVERGDLDPARLANFHALQREQRFERLKQDEAARRQRERQFGQIIREVSRERKRRGKP